MKDLGFILFNGTLPEDIGAASCITPICDIDREIDKLYNESVKGNNCVITNPNAVALHILKRMQNSMENSVSEYAFICDNKC